MNSDLLHNNDPPENKLDQVASWFRAEEINKLVREGGKALASFSAKPNPMATSRSNTPAREISSGGKAKMPANTAKSVTKKVRIAVDDDGKQSGP